MLSSFSILIADLIPDRIIFVEYFIGNLLGKRCEKLLFSPLHIIQNQMVLKNVGMSLCTLLYCKYIHSFWNTHKHNMLSWLMEKA